MAWEDRTGEERRKKGTQNTNAVCSGEKIVTWEFLSRMKNKERNEWNPRSKKNTRRQTLESQGSYVFEPCSAHV